MNTMLHGLAEQVVDAAREDFAEFDDRDFTAIDIHTEYGIREAINQTIELFNVSSIEEEANDLIGNAIFTGELPLEKFAELTRETGDKEFSPCKIAVSILRDKCYELAECEVEDRDA